MPGAQRTTGGKPYLKVIGGQIVQPAKEGDIGAIRRGYELKNGTKGTKWEIPFMNWQAKLIGISFKTTDFGEVCNLELDDAFLQLNVEGKYFKDFACKIFNADLSQPLLFHPYDMEVDDKKLTGISLQQGGQKLKNYFYDGTKNINGFPVPDESKKSKKTYWKIYFAEVAEFLTEKLKTLQFPKSELVEAAEEVFATPAEDFATDLPWENPPELK